MLKPRRVQGSLLIDATPAQIACLVIAAILIVAALEIASR